LVFSFLKIKFSSIRGDLTQKDLGKAKDAREKVDSKLRSAEFTDKKGVSLNLKR
jgi:hypothetical protein